jgi:predicted MFS family arabinose efflux permease
LGSAYHMFILWSVLIAVREFVNKFLLFFWTGIELQYSHVMTMQISLYVSCLMLSFFFFQAQAEQRGISTQQASLLLGVIGIANLVGRIILGYISDKPWTNRLIVYNVCLTICGLGECIVLFIDVKAY